MDQNLFDTYFNCFEEALRKMVGQVPGLELSPSMDTIQPALKRLSAVVRITGFNKGRVHVEMSMDLARKLYEYDNGEPSDEMDLCFFLAEFTNIVAGNGVTVLNNRYQFHGDSLRLTPPAMFTGNEIDINIPKAFFVNKYYHTKWGTIRIEIGFEDVKPAE
jgi:CheY-specific phosphatase CheX